MPKRTISRDVVVSGDESDTALSSLELCLALALTMDGVDKLNDHACVPKRIKHNERN